MFIVRILPFVGRTIVRQAIVFADNFAEFGKVAGELSLSLIGLVFTIIWAPLYIPIRAILILRKDTTDAKAIMENLHSGGYLTRHQKAMCERGAELFPSASFYREMLDLDNSNRDKDLRESPLWRNDV